MNLGLKVCSGLLTSQVQFQRKGPFSFRESLREEESSNTDKRSTSDNVTTVNHNTFEGHVKETNYFLLRNYARIVNCVNRTFSKEQVEDFKRTQRPIEIVVNINGKTKIFRFTLKNSFKYQDNNSLSTIIGKSSAVQDNLLPIINENSYENVQSKQIKGTNVYNSNTNDNSHKKNNNNDNDNNNNNIIINNSIFSIVPNNIMGNNLIHRLSNCKGTYTCSDHNDIENVTTKLKVNELMEALKFKRRKKVCKQAVGSLTERCKSYNGYLYSEKLVCKNAKKWEGDGIAEEKGLPHN
jgi:hypothetical protein